MLFAEINREVEKFKKCSYTGHVKFGIERSRIVSITINSRVEKSDRDNADFCSQLQSLCKIPEYYGSIEFDFILGKVERLNHCISLNGLPLKTWMENPNAEV
jgi:hypothetical protein